MMVLPPDWENARTPRSTCPLHPHRKMQMEPSRGPGAASRPFVSPSNDKKAKTTPLQKKESYKLRMPPVIIQPQWKKNEPTNSGPDYRESTSYTWPGLPKMRFKPVQKWRDRNSLKSPRNRTPKTLTLGVNVPSPSTVLFKPRGTVPSPQEQT